ncbi:replication-relaxation family protein [Alkaliphilus sp. B6464]|uniref:replication-relaxation family protein n=1 Tax=Alkaliphilus sp. B6464 TaxID=2731219 RepID=UPI001BAA110E|nr:replication-relaxation family protein [Alkaliphilus sp. B6464]QUH21059.1 replication-relaxation family protein [Alkaliphilus sp. B6464]
MTNREIQQQRDREIIKFIEQFKVASTDTIAELFFPSLRMAQRRLSRLVDYGVLKREREHFTFQYVYYIEKTKQMQHRLILTEFYRQIKRLGIEVVKFENEFTFFEGIRPDGFIAYSIGEKNYIAFIETELSNKPNITKYEELYKSEEWKKVLPIFPAIIWVTDNNIPKTELSIFHIKRDFSNIGILCKY